MSLFVLCKGFMQCGHPLQILTRTLLPSLPVVSANGSSLGICSEHICCSMVPPIMRTMFLIRVFAQFVKADETDLFQTGCTRRLSRFIDWPFFVYRHPRCTKNVFFFSCACREKKIKSWTCPPDCERPRRRLREAEHLHHLNVPQFCW